ncbi:hypothetical protein LCGC14_0760720 [marine sediment metagenome]|uniref:Homing endonuclease LAGLIDADG domain-containing protein n=1 Tax=marine sediment metagenome TaxID=412755 RepID=A0A0F9QL27_9ZZZZ|nr:hypothetical protein [bacterium]
MGGLPLGSKNPEAILSTEDFIDSLLEEIKELQPEFRDLSLTQLRIEVSKIIKGSSYFLKHIIARIKSSNNPKIYNPKYSFSEELLDLFEQRLEEKYGARVKNCFDLIDRYKEANDLKTYSRQQYHIHNPNLNPHFFGNLDTEERGYWFGFMLADGSITLGGDDRVRYQISIELSIKDKEQLVKFTNSIGLKTAKIGERTRTIEGVEYDMAYVTFTCKPMVDDLRNLGYFEFKDGGRLSSLESMPYNIQKSIILGFFDGDGLQGRSEIASSNVQFLYQLKEYYNIKYPVTLKVGLDADYISNNPIKPTKNVYRLSLGATFFNDLLNNYGNSMERKRIFLDEYRDKYDLLNELVGNAELLQNMVNNFPQSWLAQHFDVNVKTFHKLCLEWGINLQDNGYWTLSRLEEAREKFNKLNKD